MDTVEKRHVFTDDIRHRHEEMRRPNHHLDGDRRPDLATTNFEQDMRPRIWFNTLADRHVVDAGAPGLDHHDGTILADLDGDGDLDIASVGWEPVSLVIYENLALTWGGARRDAQPTEKQARTSFWDYLLNWW